MSAPEKLLVKIFTKHGGQFGVLTQMRKKAINDELKGEGNCEDNFWVTLIGLDGEGTTVDFKCLREDISCYMVAPFKVSAAPMVKPVSLIQ